MQVQYVRQQCDQFTALENIYLDEFQVVKETAPYKFNVLCKPYKGNQLEYQINLMFQFTSHYPSTPLKYQIEPIAGITRDNINHIIKKIEEILTNSQQKPVVFDIVEETRNWIHQYLVEGRSYHTEEADTSKNDEVFERPKFAAFTPVTIENFNAWKKEFDAKHKVDKGKKETEVKTTGKEWFLGKNQLDLQEEQQEEDDQEQQQEDGQVQPEPEEPENALFQN